jgi:hypothetical protein
MRPPGIEQGVLYGNAGGFQLRPALREEQICADQAT